FPVAVGNRWEFRVSDTNSAEETKVQTVTGTTSVSGAAAFVFETESGTGTALNRTISVQRLDGTKLVRASEVTYDVDVLDQCFVGLGVRVWLWRMGGVG
ncbi:MAG: hypothetical protein L6Q93_16950, partial [Phycisphaerae bacterium]|nr:hypothetical protein [Phycisphaerae bacterium]